MSELSGHLERVQDIIVRTQDFQVNEASDTKAIFKTMVEDLGSLADAVHELIKRAEV